MEHRTVPSNRRYSVTTDSAWSRTQTRSRESSKFTHHPSQEQAVNDLMFRHNLLNQSQLPNPLNGSASFSSPWASSPNPSGHQPLSGLGWGRDGLSGINSPFEAPSQPISSGLANASWANNAFLASTLTPGAGYPSSGLSNNRRSTQLGAIGQTPPCGQGG